MDESVCITLSIDQAIVLSHWLESVMHREEFVNVIDDRAVWSPLLALSGLLEVKLSTIFDPEYSARLATARDRLIQQLGDFGQ